MSIRIGRGRQHDVTLARQSIGDLSRYYYILADLDYQGLSHKVLTPLKKPREKSLPAFEKQINREISRRRIIIEHINRKLKCFKILS